MTEQQGFYLTIFLGVLAVAILVVPPYFMGKSKRSKKN